MDNVPMLSWFNSSAATDFAQELAAFLVGELKGVNLQSLDQKGRKRAERAMERAARKVQGFRQQNSLNVYKKSRLANAFLWSLKGAGWPDAYANHMTEWLTPRL